MNKQPEDLRHYRMSKMTLLQTMGLIAVTGLILVAVLQYFI